MPFRIAVLLVLISQALCFYDNETGFAFSREYHVTVTVQVIRLLFRVDTSQLVSSGKLLPNCADLRFRRSNGAFFPHWLVTDCGRDPTFIWLDTGTIPIGTDFYFRMLYFQDIWLESSYELPYAGEFVFLSTQATCPPTWTRFSEMDGRYIKFPGDTLVPYPPENIIDVDPPTLWQNVATDPTHIHTHTLLGETFQPEQPSSHVRCTPGDDDNTPPGTEVAAGYHKHDFDTVITLPSANEPPYFSYLICKRKKLDFLHKGFLSLFMRDTAFPTATHSMHAPGWDRYVRGSATYGSEGGTGLIPGTYPSRHTHNFGIETSTTVPTASMWCASGSDHTGISTATHKHSLTFSAGDSVLSNEAHLPLFYRIFAGEVIEDLPLEDWDDFMFSTVYARWLFTQKPPLGFTFDSSGNTRYLQLTNLTYTTGGAATHFHRANYDATFTNSPSTAGIALGTVATVAVSPHAVEHGPIPSSSVVTSTVDNEMSRGEMWLGYFDNSQPTLVVTVNLVGGEWQHSPLTVRVNMTSGAAGKNFNLKTTTMMGFGRFWFAVALVVVVFELFGLV